MTQKEMAAYIGVAYVTYQEMETSGVVKKLSGLKKIKEKTGFDTQEIMYDIENKVPTKPKLMERIRFEYALPNISGMVYPLNAAAKDAFEESTNRKYKKYIRRINECGGCFRVTQVSPDGLDFKGDLAATPELLDEISGNT